MGLNLDNLDEELRNKIVNLQNLQRTLEFITSQKMQMDSTARETEIAIEELIKIDANDTVYKSIGGIMIRSEKGELLAEKKSLKTTLEIRIKTLDQKKSRTDDQINTLRNSLQVELQNKGNM